MKKYLYWSKRTYVCLLFLALLDALLETGLSLVLEYLLNYLLSDSFDLAPFIGLGFGSLAYIAIMIGCYFGYNSLLSWYLNGAVKKLCDDLFDSILGRSYFEFHQEGTGTYVSALMNDSQNVGNHYLAPLLALPGQVFTYLAACVISLMIDWRIALFLLGFSFLVFLVPQGFNKKLNQRNEEVQSAFATLSKTYESFLLGQGTIRAASACSYVCQKEASASSCAYRASFHQGRLRFGVSSLSNLLTSTLQIGVIVVAGFVSFSRGMAMGTVLAFVQLANNLYSPLSSFASAFSSIRGMRGVNNRLLSFMQSKGDVEPFSGVPQGDLVVENLNFSYEGKPVFSHLNYVFKPGKKYWISGASGSGKSTFLRLLSCSGEPYQGTIRYGAMDFKTLSCQAVAKSIYYCEQTSLVFPFTLRDNIVFGMENNETRLHEVLALCGLEAFARERGLDAPLDPEINSSSGGETQRIALARALYRNPKILLLDEIASGLDEQTNSQILIAIFHLPMTVILVTHNMPKELEKCWDGRLDFDKVNR